MNAVQKQYQGFVDSLLESNERYIKEIDDINNDPSIPERSKDRMISSHMEYIERNNDIINELHKFIEKFKNL